MRYWLLWLSFPWWLSGEIQWHSDLEAPFSIMLKIDSQQVKLGEILEIEGTFHYPSSYELDPFTLVEQLTWSANPLLPAFTFDHWETFPLTAESKTEAQKLIIRLIPIQEGTQSISFLIVPFLAKEKQDATLSVPTPIFSIEVTSSPQHISGLAPLAPLDAQFPLGLTQNNRQLLESPESLDREKQHNKRLLQQHTFPWLSVLLGLILGGLGGLAYVMRVQLKQFLNLQPAVDPYQQAKKALSQLEASSLPPDVAYAKLTSILFSILEARLKIKIQGLTTLEIRRILAKHAFPPAVKEDILAILVEADKVKFAGPYHLAHSFQDSMQKLRNIIQSLVT